MSFSRPTPRIGLRKGGGRRRTTRACRVARVAMLALALGAVTSVRAADENKVIFPAGAAQTAPAPAGGGYGNVTLALGLILAVAGGWFVWRGRKGMPRAANGRALAIEETRSLGNRQFLVVASYEDKKFLIGVCPGRIDLLSPLHDEKARQ